MDYKTNLVLHISFSFFFLFLVHCLYSIVFLISFMDFLINKLYLVSCEYDQKMSESPITYKARLMAHRAILTSVDSDKPVRA